uniref:Uncharacterized protein n=1 Tax=Pelusios castaneus TaxID=367368 RepID=A0A8C8SG60_9SAUR
MADSGAPLLEIGEADENWALIRDKVVEERFGPSVLPVPFLEDAASYDLLHVLLRKPGRARSLLGRPRPLVPVGALEQLAQHGVEGGELARCTREYSATARGEARYEEMRLLAGSPCLIRLQLASVHKKVAFLELRPGQVALRPDLPWLRAQHSLYLIHEVFYCSGLALAVMKAQTTRTLRLPGPCPLAFCCLKFALRPRGILGPQKPMGHALPAKVAWVKLASLEPTMGSALEPGKDTPAHPSQPWGHVYGVPQGSLRQLPARVGSGPARAGGLPCNTSPSSLPTGKWPFARHWAQPDTPSHRDPDRHSMSLPLLQTLSAGSDSDG